MRPGICQNQPSACLRNCREPHRHLLHGGALSRRSSRDMLPYHRLGLGAMVGRVHDKPSQCAGSHTIPSSSARSRYSSSLFPSAQGVLFKVPRGPFSCCRYQRDRLRAPAIKLARARPRPPLYMCGSSPNASPWSTANTITRATSSSGWCISSPMLLRRTTPTRPRRTSHRRRSPRMRPSCCRCPALAPRCSRRCLPREATRWGGGAGEEGLDRAGVRSVGGGQAGRDGHAGPDIADDGAERGVRLHDRRRGESLRVSGQRRQHGRRPSEPGAGGSVLERPAHPMPAASP